MPRTSLPLWTCGAVHLSTHQIPSEGFLDSLSLAQALRAGHHMVRRHMGKRETGQPKAAVRECCKGVSPATLGLELLTPTSGPHAL